VVFLEFGIPRLPELLRGESSVDTKVYSVDFEIMHYEYMASWKTTWKKWSRFNRLAAIAGMVAIMLGVVRTGQMVAGVFSWLKEWAYGPPPVDMPLPKILDNALEEIEYNIDCLESFDRIRESDVDYPLCRPKKRYLESLFYHLSVLTSRDYYSDSTATFRNWKSVLEYYSNLENVKSSRDFRDLESGSPITLRDALFMTGYIRFFYRDFYKEIEDEGCMSFRNNEPRCEPVLAALANTRKKDEEQIARWDHMPAKATIDEGKPVRSYVDWLSLSD
jgi:hypothetical protein